MIFKKSLMKQKVWLIFWTFNIHVQNCQRLDTYDIVGGISGDEFYGNVQTIYYIKENGAKSGWELAMIRPPKTHSKSPPPEWPLVLKQSKYKNLLISNNL